MTINKKDAAAVGLTAAAAAVVGAQAAGAADLEVVAPAAYDWSGVYIGVGAGAIFGGDFPVNQGTEYDADSDFVFGGFIGVNHQFSDSSIVVGGELALQSGFDGDGDTDEDYEVNWIADGKMKLGVAFDEFLLYVFGGVSAGQMEVASCGYEYGLGGFNYGIGADWAITEQFTIGAEVMGRTFVDPYGDDNNGKDRSHWQGMLRAAFHF
jgi:outer membrane immunogenic protein